MTFLSIFWLNHLFFSNFLMPYLKNRLVLKFYLLLLFWERICSFFIPGKIQICRDSFNFDLLSIFIFEGFKNKKAHNLFSEIAKLNCLYSNHLVWGKIQNCPWKLVDRRHPSFKKLGRKKAILNARAEDVRGIGTLLNDRYKYL